MGQFPLWSAKSSTGGTSTDRSCQPCQAKERGLERGGTILRVGKRTDGEEMWVCRKMMKDAGNCQSCDDQLASSFSEKQFLSVFFAELHCGHNG
jgi:hypothetical protein